MFALPLEPFPRATGQPTPTAARRLQRDFQRLLSEPIDGIIAMPNEANILEWHYVIKGSPDTPYEGGYYYGKLVFQPDFPWKPPAICMLTPNGRFETNTRLCLSISDYHPESWNPGWTVSAILVGLHSFMNEETFAAGVRNESNPVRRKYAASSKAWNLACPEFRQMFPNLLDDIATETASSSSSASSSGNEISSNTKSVDHHSGHSRRTAQKRRAEPAVEEHQSHSHNHQQPRQIEVIELSDGE
ncbi:ubiquitin--protein ligase [Oesophagostomum dentatum]|uniref:Ubiquitin--protein ligase n=1 Tax=Oesophagostomum dentatum TaxID=61180 RepID=A0A0B1T714_OESDE|nr:ubiquitin--protein ligase [Oesophagostomum dentatum]